MINYKKYLLELIEENKELAKIYAAKIGMIDEEPDDLYMDLENRAYRLLAEYDRLAIYGIDGQEEHLQRLYERFKDDSRVQFWLSGSMTDVLPIDNPSVWLKNNNTVTPHSRPVIDYGDYRLKEKTTDIRRFVLLDDSYKQNLNDGYLSGSQKEKQLCKFISMFLKEEKEIIVSTLDEKSLLYIKGLMKGAEVVNRTITFAFFDGYQNDLLQSFHKEMYVVVPILTVEEDRNWMILKRNLQKYQREIVNEVKKQNLNKASK